MTTVRFVGLDVHAETIAVAVAEAGARRCGRSALIPNRVDALRKLIKSSGPPTNCGCVTRRGRRATWCIAS